MDNSTIGALYQAAMRMKQDGRSLEEISTWLANQARRSGLRTGNLESGKTLELTFLDAEQKIYFDGFNWHMVPLQS